MVICYKWASGAMVACRNLIAFKNGEESSLLSAKEQARLKGDEKILRLVVGSWAARLEITALTKQEADAAIKRWFRGYRGEQQGHGANASERGFSRNDDKQKRLTIGR